MLYLFSWSGAEDARQGKGILIMCVGHLFVVYCVILWWGVIIVVMCGTLFD